MNEENSKFYYSTLEQLAETMGVCYAQAEIELQKLLNFYPNYLEEMSIFYGNILGS